MLFDLSQLAEMLVGDRYGSLELAEEAVLQARPGEKENLRVLVDWLKQEL